MATDPWVLLGGSCTGITFGRAGRKQLFLSLQQEKNQLLLAMCLLTNAKGLAVGNGFSGHE